MRPQEFLEVHGAHRLRFLIADADRLNPLELDAEERPATDDVIAAILGKGLECRCDFREVLNLIKEEQRVSRDKSKARIDERNVANDVGNAVAVLRDDLELRLERKIDLDDRGKPTFGESPNASRLANLTGSFDDQRPSVVPPNPRLKDGHELAIQESFLFPRFHGDIIS